MTEKMEERLMEESERRIGGEIMGEILLYREIFYKIGRSIFKSLPILNPLYGYV